MTHLARLLGLGGALLGIGAALAGCGSDGSGGTAEASTAAPAEDACALLTPGAVEDPLGLLLGASGQVAAALGG